MSKLNEKLNAFEALEKLLNPKPLACSRSMVCDAKIVILSPDNDGLDTDEDDGGDSNGIPENLSTKQLLADVESELEYVRPQPVISTGLPSTVPLKLSRHPW